MDAAGLGREGGVAGISGGVGVGELPNLLG